MDYRTSIKCMQLAGQAQEKNLTSSRSERKVSLRFLKCRNIQRNENGDLSVLIPQSSSDNQDTVGFTIPIELLMNFIVHHAGVYSPHCNGCPLVSSHRAERHAVLLILGWSCHIQRWDKLGLTSDILMTAVAFCHCSHFTGKVSCTKHLFEQEFRVGPHTTTQGIFKNWTKRNLNSRLTKGVGQSHGESDLFSKTQVPSTLKWEKGVLNQFFLKDVYCTILSIKKTIPKTIQQNEQTELRSFA